MLRFVDFRLVWRWLLLLKTAMIFSVVLIFSGCVTNHNSSYFPVSMGNSDPDSEPDLYLKASSDHDKVMHYFAPMISAAGNKVFVFDPKNHAWAAYNEMGILVNSGRASGGRDYCPDLGRSCRTAVGKYKVMWKKDDDCISHTFPLETHGGAPMPYCMYFSARGYAIHGSYELPPSGGNASHGCVRVTPAAAEWLNEKFLSIGSSVIILPYD